MDVKQLLDCVEMRCCKLCRHAYFRDEIPEGLCKRPENAFGIFPKLIDELHSCPLWQPKNDRGTDAT